MIQAIKEKNNKKENVAVVNDGMFFDLSNFHR